MYYSLQFVLLADIGEVIGSLVGLAVLVLWVIRQIVEGNKQAAAPRAHPPAVPPQPPPRAAGGIRPAGRQADPLRNQVEEFLRRAGRQPPADQARPPQRPPQPVATNEIELLVVDEAPAPRRRLAEPFRPMDQPAKVPLQPPAAPARKPRRPAKLQRETVAEHVAENVAARARSLADQTSHLGERIVRDDAEFDVQLKRKFDHAVGTLAGSSLSPAADQPAAAASPTPAAQIAAMLTSPDGVRQAIVINEILRRPSDRW